jgi:hypothetical protein
MTEFLCLASVGRSGSTFLQRLLNTHPDVILFGEHEGFLHGIQLAYERLAAPRTVALFETGRRQLGAILGAEPVTDSPGGWSIEWTNALRSAEVAPAFARFVKDLVYPPDVRSPSHRYWGFKEIRYGVKELRFLETILPEARFLLLVRDPLVVYRSQCRLEWGLELGAEKAAADFHRAFSALADAWDALHEPNGASRRARLVCYERLVADPLAHLDLIARWLGVAPFDNAKALSVAAAQLTPQRERWTSGAGTFLDTYLATYAEEDRRRYTAMLAGAISVGADGAASAAPGRRRGRAPEGRAATRRGAPNLAWGSERRARERKLVFLHIPRTGGTTMREQISRAFAPAEICPHRLGLPRDCSMDELAAYRFFAGHFSPDDIDRIPGEKCVFTVLRDPLERLLSLRNSSICRRQRGNPASVAPEPGSAGSSPLPDEGFWAGDLNCDLDNGMARQLAGSIVATGDGTYLRDEGGVRRPIRATDVVHLAMANLGRLDFVGFADALDIAYARVAHEFGLPQAPGALPRRSTSCVQRPPVTLAIAGASPDIEAEFSRLIQLDRQVFAFARAAQMPIDVSGTRSVPGKGPLRR